MAKNVEKGPPTLVNDRSGYDNDAIKILEADLATQKEITGNQDKLIASLKKEREVALAENAQLKKTNKEAYERISELQKMAAVNVSGAAATEGFVVLGTLPLDNGVYPIPGKANGCAIPRKIEKGVLYEEVPVKTALALLNEGSGFKRALIGPVAQISGNVPKQHKDENGSFNHSVVHNRCKVEYGKNGPYFVEVIVEESKEKVD